MSQQSPAALHATENTPSAPAFRNLQLQRLVDVPQYASTAAHWVWTEWSDSGLSLENVTARLLASDQCPPTLLALRADEPLGVIGFRRFQRPNDQHLSLFIDVLFVEQSFRGQGVGSALLRSAFIRAGAFCRELFVYTNKRDWYERRGWSFADAGKDANHVVLVRRP